MPEFLWVVYGPIDNLSFSPRIEKFKLARETNHRYIVCVYGKTKEFYKAHANAIDYLYFISAPIVFFVWCVLCFSTVLYISKK